MNQCCFSEWVESPVGHSESSWPVDRSSAFVGVTSGAVMKNAVSASVQPPRLKTERSVTPL